MSIIPGWARGASRMPPWYGVGGARGPSGGTTSLTQQQQPMMPAIPQAPRNVRSGAGASGVSSASAGVGVKPRTGIAAVTPQATPQAPTNPWLMKAENTPIYGDDNSAQLSLIDRLIAEAENQKSRSSSNANQRLSNVGSTPIERYNPTEVQYQRNPELADAQTRFKQFADTGGFSDADLASIRARGVAPIRGIYANANRNLARQRSLQGGYSPGFGAASSRMAREMSEQLSAASTNVEADIADRVQSGRQFGLEGYGRGAQQENSLINQILTQNAGARNEAGRFNAGSANDAALQRERLRDSIYQSQSEDESRGFGNAVDLARLREQVLENSRSGRLNERNTGRAGSLNWEELNQRGGIALLDAMMQQYGARS